MRQLQKGEARPGMDVFFKTMEGNMIPHKILDIQDRGTYDLLSVSKLTKSGKVLRGVSTSGNDDFWF